MLILKLKFKNKLKQAIPRINELVILLNNIQTKLINAIVKY